jgi:hypothetical protein
MSEPDNSAPSLYRWAGGEAAIRRLIDRFYDRVERDELLSPFFPGGVSEDHRAHVTAWWSEVLGGPARYSKGLGGYESTVAHHRGLAPSSLGRSFSLLLRSASGRLPSSSPRGEAGEKTARLTHRRSARRPPSPCLCRASRWVRLTR